VGIRVEGTIVEDNSARISVAACVPAAARCVGYHKDKPLMRYTGAFRIAHNHPTYRVRACKTTTARATERERERKRERESQV